MQNSKYLIQLTPYTQSLTRLQFITIKHCVLFYFSFKFNLYISSNNSSHSDSEHHLPMNQTFTNCRIHAGNPLTHVCVYSQCLAPLCKICIKEHNNFHKQDGSYSEIELIEDVKEMCSGRIRQAITGFTSELDNFSVSNKPPQEEFFAFKQLREAKNLLLD